MMSKWTIIASLCIGIGLLFPPMSSGQTFTVHTAATWTSPDVSSSSRNEFRVRLTGFSPDSRTCTVEGLPADGAVSVGNCRWHQYVDGDFDLLLITLNWQAAEDVGTPANFGQFILLNDFGMGRWVRFFSADGTKASVVAAASGPARSDPSGIPLVYTSTLFVDRAVSASGDGRSSRPFKTIDEAVKAARPRTAIHIAAGTYNESVVIYQKNGIGLFGAARDAVTISNPGGFAVLCNASEIELYSLTLRGSQDGVGMLACTSKFVDIAVAGSARNGIVVANLDPADPATASSLTLHNALLSANNVGITVNHTSSLSAYGTTFERNAAHGVQVTSSGTVTLNASEISGTDGFAVSCNTADNITARNLTLRDNRIGVGMVNCTAELTDITVTGSSQNGIIVANLDPADPETASSLTLHQSLLRANNVGVLVDHTSSLSAYGTTVEEHASHGVQVTGSGTVALDDCRVSKNEYGLNWNQEDAGTRNAGMLMVSHSTIADNGRAGIILLSAVNGIIDASRIGENGYRGDFLGNGLEFYFHWRETFTISSSTFLNNASFGIFIASGAVTLENNEIDGNGENGIGIYHGCGQRPGFTDDCTVLPINVTLRDNVIRNNRGADITQGTGLSLTQSSYPGPPMRVILDGGNEFYNNRKHVGCGAPENKVALSCEAPVFSEEGVRVAGGVPLISTCAYSDVRGCLDAAACPEFCLPY